MADKLNILIVEDSPEDYEILSRALRKAEISATLTHCLDGEEAIELISHLVNSSSGYDLHDSAMPDLVLLDLNLPGTDGYGVLSYFKKKPETASIPVIVFSTSISDTDIRKSYALGANSYISKPHDLKAYIAIAENFKRYWIDSVALPE